MILKNLRQQYARFMPKGAGALFFIQMFSTLAFGVLNFTLALYMTNALKLSDHMAINITATFVAFNFFLHLLGGYVGGRFLSYRMLFSIGMTAQLIGCLWIAVPTMPFFFWGLAAFLTGAGINVTCVNCMLTQLFQPHDKRRETAFLWNYSGMNIGFFIALYISGYYYKQSEYHTLFILAGMGNLISLVLIFLKWKLVRDTNTTLVTLSSDKKLPTYFKGFALLLIVFLSLRWLLQHPLFSNNLVMFAGVAMGFVMAFLAIKQPAREDRNKIWAYIILTFASLAFWTLYQLCPMGLTLFTERNVDRHYLGMIIAPQWIQNINTVVIIFGGPLLSVLFSSLRPRDRGMTIPSQFAMALILMGLGLALLPVGIYFADSQGLSSFNWVFLCYVLQALGELFIGPIGYAMVGQLAPPRLQGLMMGTWMMTAGVAATIAAYFSKLMLGNTQSLDPLVTNASFSHTFNGLGWGTIAIGILLLILRPFILHLTQEKELFAKPQNVTPMEL